MGLLLLHTHQQKQEEGTWKYFVFARGEGNKIHSQHKKRREQYKISLENSVRNREWVLSDYYQMKR